MSIAMSKTGNHSKVKTQFKKTYYRKYLPIQEEIGMRMR